MQRLWASAPCVYAHILYCPRLRRCWAGVNSDTHTIESCNMKARSFAQFSLPWTALCLSSLLRVFFVGATSLWCDNKHPSHFQHWSHMQPSSHTSWLMAWSVTSVTSVLITVVALFPHMTRSECIACMGFLHFHSRLTSSLCHDRALLGGPNLALSLFAVMCACMLHFQLGWHTHTTKQLRQGPQKQRQCLVQVMHASPPSHSSRLLCDLRSAVTMPSRNSPASTTPAWPRHKELSSCRWVRVCVFVRHIVFVCVFMCMFVRLYAFCGSVCIHVHPFK